MIDRGPYDEHEEERRPCLDCGNTRTVAGQPCPLCGPPSQPDPAAAIKGHQDAAAMLRRHAHRTTDREYRQDCLAEALWHERQIARLTGHKGVA